MFQVHLWLGILLSVYVTLIGLSGCMLVFEDEFRAYAARDLNADLAHLATAQQVLRSAQKAYPGATPTYLLWPSDYTAAYTLYLQDAHHVSHTVLADSADGHLLTGRQTLLIDTVHNFHVYLLMGQTGFVLNCLAGIGLLIVALTGATLWWRGLRLWLRGFRVNLRGNWKCITYDSHNLVGILTLAILSFWSLTAIDFLWPVQTAKAVAFVSPLRGMKEPVLPTRSNAAVDKMDSAAVLDHVLSQIPALNPVGHLSGLALPASPTGNIVAYVDTRIPGDYSHRNIHTFEAGTGHLLTTWHYGQNYTLGDWILWSVYPLHFGTLWGMPIKIVWALLGLSLPVLSITGLLMYWNRNLCKRWRWLTA